MSSVQHSTHALDQGFGEYSASHPRKGSWRDKIHIVCLVTTITAIASTILGGISGLVGYGISFWIGSSLILASATALTGAGLGAICVLSAFVILAVKRKDRLVPSTTSLKLNAAQHKAPALGAFHSNHSLVVTKDGQETWEWKMKLIREAQQSIELSGNLCGGEEFRQALREVGRLLQQRPTLKFHLIASEEMLAKEDIQAINSLKKQCPNRAHILVTNSRVRFLPRLSTVENHVKLLVVDGKYFVAGGTSLQDFLQSRGDGTSTINRPLRLVERVQGKSSRDMDVVGKGALAQTMRLEFYKLWAVWAYKMSKRKPSQLTNRFFALDPNQQVAEVGAFEAHPSRVDNVKLKMVVSGPEQQVNQATEEYRRQIAAAKKAIRIGSLSFDPAHPIRDALVDRARQGVGVEIITNGTHKHSATGAHFFARAHLFGYTEVSFGERWNKINVLALDAMASKNNVQILEFGGSKGIDNVLYHKKVMTVDDQITTIGSYNQSRKSRYSDNELLLTIDSPKVTDQVNQILDKDREFSRRLPARRIQQMAKHPLRRLIANIFHFVFMNIIG